MIKGIRTPNSRNRIPYVPLSCRNHPEPTDIDEYDPGSLPLRSHDSFMVQARSLDHVPTEKDCKELAKAYGIKGVPLLSALTSLKFPQLFPYDFMHLIWENLIPNLILFWSGCFKGIDEGQPYVIDPHAWCYVLLALPLLFFRITPFVFPPFPLCFIPLFTRTPYATFALTTTS